MRYMMIAIMIFLVACQSTSDDTGEATASPDTAEIGEDTSPSTDEEPTPTPRPVERQPLPPTWTPTPRPGDSQDAETGETTGSALLSRSAGEWTPVFVPTRSPACGDFRARIPEQRLVLLDDVARASWSPMAGAVLYRFVIFDEDERIIHEVLIVETEHAVSASIFPAEGVFGWFVEPFDPIGFVMCPPQGDLFFVEAP